MPPSPLSRPEEIGTAVEGVEPKVESDFVRGAQRFALKHSASAAAAARLAQAELASGNRTAAVIAAKRALDLMKKAPDGAGALAVVQVLVGCERFDLAERAIKGITEPTVQAIVRARLLIERGDLSAALEILDGIDTVEGLTARGWLLLETGRFADAVRVLRRALRKGGPTPPLLTNLGYAHAALGARRKAIAETMQAQVLAPASELIGFNLAAYFIADGDEERALAEIVRLREHHPTHLKLTIAEADVHLRADEAERAHRILRRARTSTLWATAPADELAELTASLTFVEWRLGQRSIADARQKVVAELARTGYKNLDITALLPALMRTRADADELARVVERIRAANPGVELGSLDTHLALLRCDFLRATEYAVAWSEEDIFNSHAAAAAVYLLVDVCGDFERAIAIGRVALRRAGHTDPLVNNVAYALSLSGHLAEARALLPTDSGESVFLTATSALVDVLTGDLERGVAGYDRAIELAKRAARTDPDLPAYVLLNKQLALVRAGVCDAEELRGELPPEWEERPHFVLFRQMAARECA